MLADEFMQYMISFISTLCFPVKKHAPSPLDILRAFTIYTRQLPACEITAQIKKTHNATAGIFYNIYTRRLCYYALLCAAIYYYFVFAPHRYAKIFRLCMYIGAFLFYSTNHTKNFNIFSLNATL